MSGLTEPRADGRVQYFDLTEEERDAVHEWLLLHEVNPHHVPVDGLIELDEATGEWRIEQYDKVDGRRVKLEGGQAVRIVVRRRWKADLPWRMARP